MLLQFVCVILTTVPSMQAPSDAPPPVGWDTIGKRMQWEADHGFSGVVLTARDGKIAFNQAYGMANREKQIPMRTDTILAIGSTPIDFTKAGVLLLADRKKLKLDDPITKYFDQVPDDKRSITIKHLMTGRSGLPNFHDLPTDRDRDHSWIDRNEAVRRIMNQKLLFAPGAGQRHSHSAWGLLAAILEIVSGQSYPDFVREHLFKPAGMTDTGFFGETYPAEHMAIGYGPRKDGQINAPPYWGKTSWLVMGSGGQVSTALDMWRWVQAVYGGKLLSPESTREYAGKGQGLLAGGDVYGFEILYTGNQRSCMIIMSNAGSQRRMAAMRNLGEALSSLVLNRQAPRFTLGVALFVESGGGVKVQQVVAGGAAERGGLREGDILLKVSGKALGDEPMVTLNAAIGKGESFEIEVDRDGQHKSLTVKPLPRQESAVDK